MSEPLLYRIERLIFAYNDDFTLSVPRLEIRKGDSLGIMGHNGSGKTTLLKILALLDLPHRGVVSFNGQRVDERRRSLQRRIALLPQDSYLLRRSVFENIAYGLKVRGLRENLKERVHDVLQLVGLRPSTFSRRRWNELSGGEERRVALASRLILGADVLILDEPTANVDAESALLIKQAITGVKQRDKTSLVITSHDLVWLKDVTDTVLKMEKGRIIGHGTENVIHGPWTLLRENLWEKTLPDGQMLYCYNLPDENSVAVLSPTSIMVSIHRPGSISAQNILRGKIVRMTEEGDSGGVLLDVDVCGARFFCFVTRKAAESLKLLPGKGVWLLFKATSLQYR